MSFSAHQSTIGKSQTHLTPRWLLDPLGPFDLDPCAAPSPRPWDCAAVNWSSDGLSSKWFGRVWLNPPFHRYEVATWLGAIAEHGDGIALIHARTETDWFAIAWRRAQALLFLGRRVRFCSIDGVEQSNDSGAPVVLAAFGDRNVTSLKQSGIDGYLVCGWSRQFNAPEKEKII